MSNIRSKNMRLKGQFKKSTQDLKKPSLPNRKCQGAEILREGLPPPTCHVPGVTCHESRVTCHMKYFFLFFWQCGETSRWRVCYQWGYPVQFQDKHSEIVNYPFKQEIGLEQEQEPEQLQNKKKEQKINKIRQWKEKEMLQQHIKSGLPLQ